MAFEPFNSVGGYTSGIPPVPVIDSNGNFTSNVLTSGNVVANVIRGSSFLFSNGQPLTAIAAGSNTQVQFNNNGLLGASPNFSFNSTTNLLNVSNLSVSGLTNLGQVGNITISGGVAGYVLSTDGLGNLSWVNQSGGNGNGNPGGGNRAVQFNDDETFGGNSYFTYNKDTSTLQVNNIIATNLTGTLLTGNQLNITAVGNLANLTMANGGNIENANWVIADYFMGNAHNLYFIPGANVQGPVTSAGYAAVAAVAATVTNNNQPNITSTGTLSTLTVSGNVNLGDLANVKIFGGTPGYVISTDGNGNLSWSAGGGGGNGSPGGANTQIQYNDNGTFGGNAGFTFNELTGSMNVPGNLTVAGNIIGIVSNAAYATNAGTAVAATLATNVLGAAQPNITSLGTLTTLTVNGTTNLGNVGNVKITGGSANYYLQTDGAGNLNWVPGAGGGGNPGGSNTQIQYNDSGAFNGTPNLTWDESSNTMQVAGHLIANTFQMGSGAYTFSNSFVYFATTASTSVDQIIWDIPIADVNGIDFNIFGTCGTQNATQSAKISVLARGNTVVYNEYAGLSINGGVASFSVGYVPGNIITPASIALKVTPDFADITEYNMQIIVYSDYP